MLKILNFSHKTVYGRLKENNCDLGGVLFKCIFRVSPSYTHTPNLFFNSPEGQKARGCDGRRRGEMTALETLMYFSANDFSNTKSK